MTLKKLLAIIKKNEWKEEETQTSIYIIDHAKTIYLYINKIFARKLYSISLYAARGDYALKWTQFLRH